MQLLDARLPKRVGGSSSAARSAERGGAASMERKEIPALAVATNIWLEISKANALSRHVRNVTERDQ